jgi:hypothetical protein
MKTIVCPMLMLLVVGLALAVGGVQAAVVDHGVYAGLLDRHVKNGMVDYRGFQQDEAILDRYLDTLAAVDPATLSPDEQFAFYTNAYNAWTIKLILSRYPEIRSIRELGSLFRSPWKKKIARINGELLTLDQIEHDILRKQFKDPRVHFAVNCASKGCPPLRDEPFTGNRLDSQLNQAAADFINAPRFNRLEGDILYISKIFDWFSEDFDDDIIDTIIQFADAPLRDRLEKNRARIRVKYLDYDWSLNNAN